MSSDDEYVISTHGKFRIRLEHDPHAGNPREEFDQITHVVSIPDHTYYPPAKTGGPLAHAWNHYLDRTGRGRRRDLHELFDRYVRVFHDGRTLFESPHDAPTRVWYVLRAEVIGTGGWPEPVSDAQLDATLAGDRDQYRAWEEGDVWGWVIEEEIDYHRADHANDTDCHSVWEQVEDGSTGGYYGWQDAEGEAKREFASFLRHAGHVS